MIKRIFLLTLILLIAFPALAQDNAGQFWVQAFEDRNGNGQHDAGEPFLTRGVSVDLLNAGGVVMASATLDNAAYASRGFVGFLYLAPGEYTAVISAPNLTATTPDRVTVTITQGEAPVTVMFGAQKEAPLETAVSAGNSSLMNSEIARIAVAGFAAMVVAGGMVFLGLVIYALVLRRRAPRDVRRTTTGSMRPVRIETGEMQQTSDLNKP